MVRLEEEEPEDMVLVPALVVPAFSAGCPQLPHSTVRERRLYSPGSPELLQ